MINTKELQQLLAEASELSTKPNWTKSDERRNAYLLAAISAVKSGVSLIDINVAELNDVEDRMGVERTMIEPRSPLTREQRHHIGVWQRFIKNGKIESRDMTVGNGTPAFLTGNLGSFVPLEWFKDVFAAKKNTDALFDPNVVTYVETTHGRPMQFGYYGDTENVAQLVSEGNLANEQDLSSVGGVMIGAYTFRTPTFHASIESLLDVEMAGGLVELFKKFSAERIALGVGSYLVNGQGPTVKQPTGLLNAIETLEGNSVVAAGSSKNTGGAETGATSVGSADIANLFYALDEAYRDSPKCAWLMSSGTLGKLAAITTQQGLPIVQWQGPEAWILGKPVRISPSMPSIGAQNIPILFGDLSYFCVRCSVDPITRVQLYREAPGLIERGKIGLRAYVRYDSALLFGDTGSPAPIVYLENHS
jgi:HK97 family phage major capsid protein